MTNYIEEMMKTAGIEPDKRFKECKENAKNRGLCTKYPCIECKSSVFYDKYPDFTPERQLEVFKLICFYIMNNKSKRFSTDKDYQDMVFTQALAEFITELMTAEQLDKEKIKEILEG